MRPLGGVGRRGWGSPWGAVWMRNLRLRDGRTGRGPELGGVEAGSAAGVQGPAHCLRSSLRGRLWLQDPVGRGWGRGFWVMGAGTQRALEKVELRQRAACSQGAGGLVMELGPLSRR